MHNCLPCSFEGIMFKSQRVSMESAHILRFAYRRGNAIHNVDLLVKHTCYIPSPSPSYSFPLVSGDLLLLSPQNPTSWYSHTLAITTRLFSHGASTSKEMNALTLGLEELRFNQESSSSLEELGFQTFTRIFRRISPVNFSQTFRRAVAEATHSLHHPRHNSYQMIRFVSGGFPIF